MDRRTLSHERFGEPIERAEAALAAEPDRLASGISETRFESRDNPSRMSIAFVVSSPESFVGDRCLIQAKDLAPNTESARSDDADFQ